MTRGLQWDVQGRDWPNRAASRFVDTDRLRWHVQTLGSGPVMLLLHGTGASTHSWRDIAPLLARDFTIIAPDLPGHGFTVGRPLGGLAIAAVSRSIGQLIAKLDLQPAFIVGHSAGAAIAIRMTLDGVAAPDRLIGLDAALLPFPGIGARLFPALARALFVNPFVPRLFASMAGGTGETARFLQRSTGSTIDERGVAAYRTLISDPGHVHGAMTMMADWDLEWLQADLPSVAVPTLLLHGDRDAAIPLSAARQAAALIPGAHLAPLAGLGHLAHEEAPEMVARLVTDFVKEG